MFIKFMANKKIADDEKPFELDSYRGIKRGEWSGEIEK